MLNVIRILCKYSYVDFLRIMLLYDCRRYIKSNSSTCATYFGWYEIFCYLNYIPPLPSSVPTVAIDCI